MRWVEREPSSDFVVELFDAMSGAKGSADFVPEMVDAMRGARAEFRLRCRDWFRDWWSES
jgi:hypothetical protein